MSADAAKFNTRFFYLAVLIIGIVSGVVYAGMMLFDSNPDNDVEFAELTGFIFAALAWIAGGETLARGAARVANGKRRQRGPASNGDAAERNGRAAP